MTFQTVEDYLLRKPGSEKTFPFDEFAAVYKVGGKMFALMPTNKTPTRISLKCDPGLAESLREQYESIMPGYHLNKRHWITILLSGQVNETMLHDLINHSYQLVFDSLTQKQKATIK